ncbi:MAG: translation initiation factor IF-2 [Candidatus Zambryskibacteria bacterium RIFCSPLOWO2_01_FULL_39_39]|uniref:Translation initiation factor IF-2 n=2 Tax=Patescibacteria group TaxID=1783273 RepID=A0A1G2TZX9_9BACT|nr:MAG: Translation initiation factor IF-2 protein [Candidatus Woesebacteria bacterium GW2011_GWA1_39_8]OHA86667.1 MAG: translation initiation factor IF-2 [Candidatus Zambryskibacteria bacterium RIFCSPHIGHO2_01_FULL_39_63]OHA95241.1 MAG: translation initiation factor IF-2 [Candidatus Zambryskibacteria bacterium RIFCSPHIGHO2_02_FULL_39_19]OHA98835.1 MAG: translation initiation factor IF-2 [Candidatus Zambryskibacteria bacterium RIFCSPHIGHO2_12_FULL_39_21]OHB02794.1 MAG: translation initiation fa
MKIPSKKEIGNLLSRSPIVVVMGHIDHGKSTLLDYIRKTNTTKKEAGGITQHVSAYEAEVTVSGEERKMTFLDTPGHEAFCSVRERSAQVADIAVLIVSAEDGVKPQTIEALNCITKGSMPFIVALNKIDRTGVNLDKVKQDLAENGILVEGWGGTVPIVAISGKTGEGVPELLEMIALQSDIEELKGDPSALAEGFVIESDLNPKQGISATLLIKNGTLKTGMFVATHGAYAPIRAIENYKGENLQEASFSSPVKIVGWSAGPSVGSQFKTLLKKEDALEFAAKNIDLEIKEYQENIPSDSAFLEVVVKADTFGSLNAIEHELLKLRNPKIAVKIISKGVGNITEKDLKVANIKNSLVLGFNIEADKSAQALAMRDNTEIKTYKIIYELIDYVKEKIKENTPVETVKTVTGIVKIIRIFSKNKDKQVLGGRIEEGEIKLGGVVEILRRDSIIGTGKIKELQTQKIKTNIVKEGQEFGMMLESKIELVAGDILKATSLIKQESH